MKTVLVVKPLCYISMGVDLNLTNNILVAAFHNLVEVKAKITCVFYVFVFIIYPNAT